MNYKISVIMPIYNAKDTLVKAIDSVINQTIGFENIELILIDDNSTDNSKDIINKYSNRYSNIKSIFLKENHGLPSFSRNIGIIESNSEYIMFIDHDDEYMEEFCEKMYNEITTTDADVVSSKVYNMKSHENPNLDNFNNNNSKTTLYNVELLSCDDYVVWNKIFKKDIILKNNIKFPETRNEDYAFCCNYFLNSNKLIILNYVGYIWNNVEESLSKGYSYNQTKDYILMYQKLCETLSNYNINPAIFFNPHIRGGYSSH